MTIYNHYTQFIGNCQVRGYKLYLYRGDKMISYEPLYKTMKEKGITTYTLINKYNISRGLIDRLKHNRPITTVTLDDLCKILDCRVEDILVYTKDED